MKIIIELLNKKDRNTYKRLGETYKIIGQIDFNINLKCLQFHWFQTIDRPIRRLLIFYEVDNIIIDLGML